MELAGKVAVVTGVSRGIGKATVQALLEKGVKVTGWGRSNSDIRHENYKFFPTDIRYIDQVQRSMQNTLQYFGMDIHVLVNNAGLGYMKDVDKIPIQEWKEMFDTNVHGLFYCTKYVVPLMKDQKMGHIINIASTAGLGGIPGASGYSGTKHAVRGISHSLYKELKPHNIKVTCVYPGAVNTDFFDNYPEVTSNETMLAPEDVATTIINTIETSDNFLTVDVEVRPMNPKYSV